MMSLTGNSEFGTRENFLQAFPSVCATVSIIIYKNIEINVKIDTFIIIIRFPIQH